MRQSCSTSNPQGNSDMQEPTSHPKREEKGMASNNLTEGIQVCVRAHIHVCTCTHTHACPYTSIQCLNPCPSSKPLSNCYSAQSREVAMRPRRAEKELLSTFTISFLLPETQVGLKSYKQLGRRCAVRVHTPLPHTNFKADRRFSLMNKIA